MFPSFVCLYLLPQYMFPSLSEYVMLFKLLHPTCCLHLVSGGGGISKLWLGYLSCNLALSFSTLIDIPSSIATLLDNQYLPMQSNHNHCCLGMCYNSMMVSLQSVHHFVFSPCCPLSSLGYYILGKSLQLMQ